MDWLTRYPSLFAKQTRRGCLQELCGCEAQTEFNIATMSDPKTNVFYALEESSCCIRLFCPTVRPFIINVSTAEKKEPVAAFERPCACPLASCKCCCFQKMIAKDPSGKVVGSVSETCWLCVPGFTVKNDSGNHIYDLHQPTCCGGMCVDICKEGCCNCRIPFYIYPPSQDQGEVGKIVKVGIFSFAWCSYVCMVILLYFLLYYIFLLRYGRDWSTKSLQMQINLK